MKNYDFHGAKYTGLKLAYKTGTLRGFVCFKYCIQKMSPEVTQVLRMSLKTV